MELDFEGLFNPKCHRPPKGWRCSREANHSGPCAAHPQGWRKLFWLVRLTFVEYFAPVTWLWAKLREKRK